MYESSDYLEGVMYGYTAGISFFFAQVLLPFEAALSDHLTGRTDILFGD
jgi:hypothetical protein